MRILVIGAGAIGGYFGARLLAAGRDITFLVRPRRAAQLALGLSLRSPLGDLDLPPPPTVTSDALDRPFDLVLLSCKAYDLAEAVRSFAPSVGAGTAILPLLNGMRHLDVLADRFGPGAVMGGQCVISTTLDAAGRVIHLNDVDLLSFGELAGGASARAAEIGAVLSGAGFEARLSEAILQEMWEKWVFIASGAGLTCLMRAAVGDIVAAGEAGLGRAMLDEAAAIAASQGFAPREPAVARSRAALQAPGSSFVASMLRDIERGAPIEADHIVGDLLRRGADAGVPHPLLGVAHAQLKSYEARRAREASPP